eukprot:1158044-Pelagomonas_calceolata.AAC.4
MAILSFNVRDGKGNKKTGQDLLHASVYGTEQRAQLRNEVAEGTPQPKVQLCHTTCDAIIGGQFSVIWYMMGATKAFFPGARAQAQASLPGIPNLAIDLRWIVRAVTLVLAAFLVARRAVTLSREHRETSSTLCLLEARLQACIKAKASTGSRLGKSARHRHLHTIACTLQEGKTYVYHV